MPRLHRLSGKAVVALLQRLGFEIARIRGSHFYMQRKRAGRSQIVVIPVHGNQPLPIGTLRGIVRQVAEFVTEQELNAAFYGE